MVCMSYPGTLKMVEKLCEDHDVEVQFWCDDLKRNLDEKLDEHTVGKNIAVMQLQGCYC